MPSEIGYIMVEQDDPQNKGFVTRRYTRVLIEMTPGTPGWSWIQKDRDGIMLDSHSDFLSEADARDAAAVHFGGRWSEDD